ncbi:MAG TPA: chemotaxis protein CheW [Bryobacteraceae bacterium]|nr:chemotaxis protein CheW [Bryobacteraceae bacterium]
MIEAATAPPQRLSANGPASADPAATQCLQARYTARAERLARRADLVPPPDVLEVLVFLLGEERYAVALTDVGEVTPAAAVTRIPGAAPEVLGVIAVRGEILPVMNLRRIVGLPERQDAGQNTPAGHTVLLRVPGSRFAMTVDRVEGLSSILRSSPVAEEADPNAGHRLLTQVADGTLTFLDTQALLTVFTKEISPR